MGKNIELTGFNGQTMSNGERLQPSVSGIGTKTTLQGNPVTRESSTNTPIYQGYYANRTQGGAIACLNLIYNRCIPSFPTSDRSAPSTFVVVYADKRGSVGNTIPHSPITFHYKEWREIVALAKEYADSALLSAYVQRGDYNSAIQHLDSEIKARYISANLIPSDEELVDNPTQTDSTVIGLSKPPSV